MQALRTPIKKQQKVSKKTKIKNKAPRAKVPNIGNQSSGGMWGF